MDEISADLLPEDIEKELDLELLPTNVLNKDVRALAGELGFSISDIAYICVKPSPFTFLLDQWCKRVGKHATLEKLKQSLSEIDRPDLAKTVDMTIKKLKEATSFNHLQVLGDLQEKRVERRDEDCTFTNTNNQTKETEEEKVEIPPYVYAVYYPESDEFVDQIHKYLNILRADFGIDTHSNMTDIGYNSSKEYFVFHSLQKADFVLVFCSPAFKQINELKTKSGGNDCVSEKYKELMFTHNFILKDIYRNKGINSKFIPIVMDNFSRREIINILLTSKSYSVPDGIEDLVRRIFDVPQAVLPPMAPTITFQPKFL